MLTSNRCKLACAIALAIAAPTAQAANVFYESFFIPPFTVGDPGGCPPDWPGGAGTYPFPVGWLLRNVDNRTPSANVSYVNDAWEDREDFAFDVTQCAAFSTSWYAPAGAADDWAWTPAIALPATGATLSWRAITYDPSYRDGYEVRVMTSPDAPTGGTGVIGNQLTNSTQIFSVGQENTSWTQHSFDLAAYVGQTVYIGFHNNSFDKFLLLIDDVTIIDFTPDAVAQASTPFASEYSRAPDGFTVDATLGFTAFNGGGATLTNVVGTATFELNSTPTGLPLTAPPVSTLAIGASAPITFGAGNQFSGSGTWSVSYAVSSDQDAGEVNTANNTVVVSGPTIGGNEYARSEGSATGQLGIGAGNGGEMGVQFTLLADTTVEGIRFGMLPQSPTIDDPANPGNQIPNPWPGQQLIANLRGFDTTTPPGKPGALIDTTVAVISTLEGGEYDVAFSAGPHLLTAGTYVATVSEPNGSPVAMSLPLHDNRFVAGTTWTNWPTNPSGDWANFESFGASFAKTPEVSLLTEMSIFKDGFEVPAPGLKGPTRAWHAPAPVVAPSRPLRKAAPTRLVTGR